MDAEKKQGALTWGSRNQPREEKLPWGPDADQLEEAGKFAAYLNESKTG